MTVPSTEEQNRHHPRYLRGPLEYLQVNRGKEILSLSKKFRIETER